MTAAPEVVVMRTGTANLASVLAGLRRAGTAPRLSDALADVERARRLVLPGVGTLAAAMAALADGRDRALAERVCAGRPTLAICLGLQILLDGSEESPDAAGVGAFAGRATRFGAGARVPQLGWNRVAADRDCELVESGYYYFANSYRLERPPAGTRAARSDHGGPFVAAFERGAVLACQCHPELSGDAGIELLCRWVAAADGGGAAC